MAEPREVIFHRYKIPPSRETHDGWAIVVLGSDGFFATVSDWGNYAFLWTHFGDGDFRHFVLGLDADYLRIKLDPSKTFDAVGTVDGIKRSLLTARRARDIEVDEARDAWDETEHIGNETDFHDWVRDHGHLVDYQDVVSTKPDSDIMGFVTKVLPRLKEAIRVDLDSQRESVGPGRPRSDKSNPT